MDANIFTRIFSRFSRARGAGALHSTKASSQNPENLTPNQKPRKSRINERGNVFFTLFGAVAIVGVLGAGIMATMRGPLSTMVEVNRREQAKAEARVAASLILATSGATAGGDNCTDLDGLTEGIAPGAAIGLTGGGAIPATVSAVKNDPWGNPYGYCAWDHGIDAATSGGSAGACTSAGILAGDTDTNNYAVAVISAGPNGVFDTTCSDHNTYLNDPGGAVDDIVEPLTYNQAVAGSGGLWSIKSGDPTIAEISKDLEVTGGGKFTDVLDLTDAAAQLQLGEKSLTLPTQAVLSTCNAANENLLRINTANNPDIVEICNEDDGSPGSFAWESVAAGANLWSKTGSDVYYDTGNVGIGLNNPNDALDVVGTAEITGATALGSTLGVTGATTLSSTLGVTGTSTLNNDVTITGGATGGATDALSVRDSSSSVIFTVQNDGKVGVGTSNPTEELDVTGDVNATNTYMLDGTKILDNGGDTTNILLGDVARFSSSTNYMNLGDAIHADLTTANKRVGIGFADTYDVSAFNDTLEVNGTVDISDTLNVTNDTTVGGDLTVSGDDITMGTNTAGHVLVADGTNFNPVAMSGDVQINGAGATTIQDDAVQENDIDASSFGAGTGSTCLKTDGTSIFTEACSGGGGGDGLGGKGLPDVLANDDDAAGANAVGFGNIAIGSAAATAGYELDVTGETTISGGLAIGSTTLSSGAATLEVDVTGEVGATEYCDADGNNCFTTGEMNQDIAEVLGVGNNAGGATTLINLPGLAIGSTVFSAGAQTLEVDVTGDIGATYYCDADGNNCFTAADIASGGGGLWSVGTGDDIYYNSGTPQVGIGTASPEAILDIAGTGAFITPRGTTGERPGTGINGMIRYNSTTGKFEGYQAGGWTNIITAAAAPDRGIQFNSGGNFTADANFTYTSTGYLGLGTAAPSAMLNVTGNADIDTNLNVDGNISVPTGTLAVGSAGPSTGGEQDLEVDVTGDIGAVNYCDASGNNCFTASDVAGNAAPGNDGEIHFTSGGQTTTDPNFVFTSSGRLGLGTATPGVSLDVAGLIRPGYDAACTATEEGAIRYVSATDTAELCDGTSWLAVNTGTSGLWTAGTGDNIYYNSGTAKVSIGATAASTGGEQDLELDVTGDVGATNYCDADGNNCFTPATIASGALAHGNDNNIQFNSGGRLWSNDTLAFTSAGKLGIGTATPTVGLQIDTTDAILIPRGTTLQRPAGTDGMIRYNSTDGKFEGYQAGSWQDLITTSGGKWVAGTGDDIYYNSGASMVGIGLTDPAVSLDVAGLIRPGYDTTCTATEEGAIRYDSGSNTAELCDGASWLAVNTGVGGKWSDGVESGEIYYTSNTGIGTNDPAVKLDVNGTLRIADGGESCDGTIPGAIRYRSGIGVEYCDGTAWNTIAAAGSGVILSITPLSLTDMDVTGPGSPATGVTRTFTVKNNGSVTSNALTYVLTGDTGNFNVTADTCTGNTLAQNATCTIDVQPQATADGAISAQLTIPHHNVATANLSGTASSFGCYVGQAAFGGIVADCDTYGADKHLIVMESGCDGSTNEPTCSGGNDTVTKQWSTESIALGPLVQDANNGDQNTVNLLNFGRPVGYYPAIEYCANMILNGYDDWFLPSYSEFSSLITPGVALGDLTGFPSYYWTSYEASNGDARKIIPSSGVASSSTKATGYYVRCARKEGVALPAAQSDTTPNAITFATKFAASAGATVASDTKTVTGITQNTAISITGDAGAEYSINGGAYTAAAGTLSWGDTVAIHLTSPAAGTRAQADLTIGSSTFYYSVITEGDCGGSCAGVDKRVFATSTTYTHGTSFGGVAGADTQCQTRADTAGIGGTWKAIISATGTSLQAINRMDYNWDRLVNMNGDVLATSPSGLWDGAIDNPVGYDETGSATTGYVWTGTLSNGVMGSNCTDWTNYVGIIGDSRGNVTIASSGWIGIAGGSIICQNANYRLYCQEVTAPTVTLTATPNSAASMNVIGPGPTGTEVTFTIENTGSGTSAALGYSLSNALNFTVTTDTCSGNTLAPAATCTMGVTPTASADGDYNGTLTVQDSTNNVSVAIGMSGQSTGFGDTASIWKPGTGDDIYYNSGTPMVGIGTTDPTVGLQIDTTDAILIPRGTTGERPTGTDGMIRYNSTDGKFEGYQAGSWQDLITTSGGKWVAGTGDNIYYNSGTAKVSIGATAASTGGEQDLELDVTGDVGATNYCDADGNNCFTPATIASGALAHGNDNNIQFNSGGRLWSNDTLAFTSAGKLGIGTATPTVGLQIDTTDAILIPRGTTLQRPAGTDGMIRYNSTDGKFEGYQAGSWQDLITTSGGKWVAGTGDDIYYNSGASMVGIGTTDPTVGLQIDTTDAILIPRGTTGERPGTGVDGMIRYNSTTPGFEVREAGAWVAMGAAVSDKRLKTDLQPLNGQDILERISRVNTYSYLRKDGEQDRRHLGVIAQEIEEIFPEVVSRTSSEEEIKSVDYRMLTAPLIEAVKTLKDENKTLRAELETIKTQEHAALEDLRRDVAGLKAHTGYGTSKAEISLLLLLGVLLGGLGAVIVTHRRKA
ncbi:MAG: tail fiber domain-containing protein [Rhodospirillales bacterium]|nr:tail fiber domain-containing protein [Rhodospirillales bacterium]